MTDTAKITIAVLMSVYNGEKYLREQIDSILSQKGVQTTLLIRDDGSSDNTLQIIREYQTICDNIELLQGDNLGVGNSFMTLLKHTGVEFDFFAFADQDDIWLPDKLSVGVRMLQENQNLGEPEKPLLYCSNQTLVDSAGNYLGERHEKPIDTSYMQILCNNRISGCTMVWNQALQAILSDPNRLPSSELLHKRIHDVWVGMVAAVTGKILYDPDSYIQYRQHADNAVGVRQEGLFHQWKKKLKDPSLQNGRSCLAAEIIERDGDLIMDSEVKDRLILYGGYQKSQTAKRQLLKDMEICRYSGESRKALQGKIMLGLF